MKVLDDLSGAAGAGPALWLTSVGRIVREANMLRTVQHASKDREPYYPLELLVDDQGFPH